VNLSNSGDIAGIGRLAAQNTSSAVTPYATASKGRGISRAIAGGLFS